MRYSQEEAGVLRSELNPVLDYDIRRGTRRTIETWFVSKQRFRVSLRSRRILITADTTVDSFVADSLQVWSLFMWSNPNRLAFPAMLLMWLWFRMNVKVIVQPCTMAPHRRFCSDFALAFIVLGRMLKNFSCHPASRSLSWTWGGLLFVLSARWHGDFTTRTSGLGSTTCCNGDRVHQKNWRREGRGWRLKWIVRNPHRYPEWRTQWRRWSQL